MDPITGGIIVAMIQVIAEYAKKAGMSREQLNTHFLTAYDQGKLNDPDKLPDAKLPDAQAQGG